MSHLNPNAWEYCEKMLPLVSRTFALNIQRLTGTLYQAVLIGYLLFRMADTLEDSPALSEEEKIAGLTSFAQFFDGKPSQKSFFPIVPSMIKKIDPTSPEGDLVAHGDLVLICYTALPATYREIIGQALKESSLGMSRYQTRKKALSSKILQLKDWNDLTLYCYYVAGVVGKMLTKLFCLNKQLTPLYEALAREQIHFGIALQMTNIAKDYPGDLTRGWCYLPKTLTDSVGVTPGDLLANPFLKRPEITRRMIEKTLPHLDGAYHYIARIPSHLTTIRMFCIIPFVLAYHTLDFLRQTQTSKLSRERVQQVLKLSKTFSLSNNALKTDYEQTLRHAPLAVL